MDPLNQFSVKGEVEKKKFQIKKEGMFESVGKTFEVSSTFMTKFTTVAS